MNSTQGLRRLVAAAAMLAITLTLAAPTATSSAATPIDHLVDCTDSFWAIACGFEPPTPADEVLGISIVQIDSDPTCALTTKGMIICQS